MGIVQQRPLNATGRFVKSSIIQRSLWDYEFNRLPKQMHISIHLFIVLNRCVCFILFYRVSAHINKQGRGVYGARASKENIFLTYKQAMKIFSLPTCSTIPTSYLARARRYDK